jgi:hypothetical protein
VISKFALPAARKITGRRGSSKMIVVFPGLRRNPAKNCGGGGGQDSSIALDTEWGDKFRTESGSFIAA